MLNLTLPNPTTPADLIRYARSSEAARAILAAGYMFELDVELEIIFVYKPQAGNRIVSADYMIDEDGCSCPDFLKRGSYCKHTLAAYLQQAAEIAQCAEYETRIASYGVHESLLTHDALR